MKCDKLKAEPMIINDDYTALYYPKESVDSAIAELKAEAYKVIAELKKACKDKDDWCLHTLKENRHHKYKRCLAMARWCMAKYNEWAAYYPTTTTRKMKFLDKWEKRWIAIAEKFKPNNSTTK